MLGLKLNHVSKRGTRPKQNPTAIPITKQGLYSLSGKTSYGKISWSLEAARFGFKLFQSLWNLTSTSAAALPRCQSNFRALRLLQHPISRLRDFTRYGGKTSYSLVNRGPGFLLTRYQCTGVIKIRTRKLLAKAYCGEKYEKETCRLCLEDEQKHKSEYRKAKEWQTHRPLTEEI